MDEKGRLGVRNWDFSGQPGNAELVLKQVSDVSAHHQAAFLKMNALPDRHSVMSKPNYGMSSMDFSWAHQKNFPSASKSSLNSLQATQVNPEMAGIPNIPTPQNDNFQSGKLNGKPTKVKKQQSSVKKSNRVATKILRPKQPKKQASAPTKKKCGSASTGKHEKKNPDTALEGVISDFSDVPSPVCSCTGVPRQCYRWGAGGWQSSCCTTTISQYPLPMSTTRPGARLAGRKMSNGAYGKLLQRLASEGYDLSCAVDLKSHWARHGTNKFVTIR